jgi:hypothetical protein
MTTQTEPIKPSKEISKVIIANSIIILFFMFAPYTETLKNFSSFLQYEISSVCTAGPWFTPRQALSISASMTFSILIAIYFSFFGTFTKQEVKRERNGLSVIFVLALVLAFAFYIVVFYIPCGIHTHHEVTQGKARLGEAIFYYVRTNSLIFTILISFICGLFTYGAALALKIISSTK